MAQCDIYVQPSRHEGYCITLAEARIFHKPIITTNTGASEQIIHEETGLITGYDEEQLYQAIKQLLEDDMLRNQFTKNLSRQIVDTTMEMDKFFRMTKGIS
jgi:glycosyltransferase involved in cell wall biosynthesis